MQNRILVLATSALILAALDGATPFAQIFGTVGDRSTLQR